MIMVMFRFGAEKPRVPSTVGLYFVSGYNCDDRFIRLIFLVMLSFDSLFLGFFPFSECFQFLLFLVNFYLFSYSLLDLVASGEDVAHRQMSSKTAN